MKKFIKKIIKKIGSRKFQAWMVATVLLYVGKLESFDWVIVTGIYIGVNVLQKIIELKKQV